MTGKTRVTTAADHWINTAPSTMKPAPPRLRLSGSFPPGLNA